MQESRSLTGGGFLIQAALVASLVAAVTVFGLLNARRRGL
jgi:hypothetical protein